MGGLCQGKSGCCRCFYLFQPRQLKLPPSPPVRGALTEIRQVASRLPVRERCKDMVVTYVPRWLRGSNETMVVKEFIASCPGCKTFETLWFRGDVLTPTKRFSQKGDGKVYHDCGWEMSCQLFFSRYEEGNNGNYPGRDIPVEL